jgi:GMP reductase
MRILEDVKLDYQDVLIKPNRTVLESRSQVNLEKTFKFKSKEGKESSFSGIPIIASNMNTGTFNMLDVFSKNKMFVAINKYQNWFKNDYFDLAYLTNENIFVTNKMDQLAYLERFLNYGFYTIGMNEDELFRLKEFYLLVNSLDESNVFSLADGIKICIDIANGYIHTFPKFIEKVRNMFPNNYIVAGNVCTPEMTQELILAGASCVKIGIGSGAGCTTRRKTSVGYPQLSATIECSDVAHGFNAHIIADGGITYTGDFSKAFVANADFVMAGGFFSGTDECDAEIVTKKYISNELQWLNGEWKQKIEVKQFMEFYGMSSQYAQEKYNGGMNTYRTSEGAYELVEYKGSVQTIIDDILGGLRSCGTYIGAKDIKNFGKCGSFIKVNRIHNKF